MIRISPELQRALRSEAEARRELAEIEARDPFWRYRWDLRRNPPAKIPTRGYPAFTPRAGAAITPSGRRPSFSGKPGHPDN